MWVISGGGGDGGRGGGGGAAGVGRVGGGEYVDVCCCERDLTQCTSVDGTSPDTQGVGLKLATETSVALRFVLELPFPSVPFPSRRSLHASKNRHGGLVVKASAS